MIERVTERTGLRKKDCAAAVNGLLSAVTKALQKGEPVKLAGFGGFEVKRRAARMGRNPQNGKPEEIPAQTVPVFKAGRDLKECVACDREK